MKEIELLTEVEYENLTVVDTETSLKSHIGDQNRAFYDVVEVGVILVSKNFEIIDTFQSFLKPFFRFNPTSCVAPHITNEILASAPKFPQIIDRLISTFETSVIIGQNTQFDIRALKMALEIYSSAGSLSKTQTEKFGSILNRPYFDTQKLFKVLYPYENSSSLTHMTKILNIETNTSEKHMALEDATLTLEVFKSLDNLAKTEGVKTISDLYRFQSGKSNLNSQLPLF